MFLSNCVLVSDIDIYEIKMELSQLKGISPMQIINVVFLHGIPPDVGHCLRVVDYRPPSSGNASWRGSYADRVSSTLKIYT